MNRSCFAAILLVLLEFLGAFLLTLRSLQSQSLPRSPTADSKALTTSSNDRLLTCSFMMHRDHTFS